MCGRSARSSFLPLPLDASNTESLGARSATARARYEILFSVCEVTDLTLTEVTGNRALTPGAVLRFGVYLAAFRVSKILGLNFE